RIAPFLSPTCRPNAPDSPDLGDPQPRAFISAEERQDEQAQGGMALGGGLLAALILDMKKQGLEVAELDRDDNGGVIVRAGKRKPICRSVRAKTPRGGL